MEDITLYTFNPGQWPINERFCVIDFKILEEQINEFNIYKEGYYCFLLMEKGEATIVVDGQEEDVKSPVLICGLPGDTWEWKKRKDVEGSFICFDANTLMSGLKGGFSLDPIPFLNPEQRFPFICLSEERFNRLNLLVRDMKECICEYPVYYDLIRAELWQFIFLAEKEYVLNGYKGRKRETKNYLMHFIKLVNIHYAAHHDAQFYASEMHITPNYLNKITNSLIGMSAFDYISNRIMAEAKILLKLTNINVSELAYKLGYENPGYFIRSFKKIVGMTPLEYHKKGTL